MTAVPLDAGGPGAWTPPPAVRLYTGAEAAKAVGLSLDRFRKVRTEWTRDRDFPAEINEPGEPIRYLAAAVDRWVLNRSRRVHLVEGAAVPEPTAAAVAATRAAASHGRAQLRALKGD
jgi:hypothetical protein